MCKRLGKIRDSSDLRRIMGVLESNCPNCLSESSVESGAVDLNVEEIDTETFWEVDTFIRLVLRLLKTLNSAGTKDRDEDRTRSRKRKKLDSDEEEEIPEKQSGKKKSKKAS